MIVALDSQAKLVRKIIVPVGNPTVEAGRKISHGFYKGRKVHVVKSGPGLVLSTQTATMLLSRYPLDFVISYGLAGGLDERTQTGSFFVADKVTAHNRGMATDFGISMRPKQVSSISKEKSDRAYAERMRKIANSATKSMMNLEVQVTSGTLVSGDEFISSPARRSELRDKFNALAVDMNGTGITVPCASYNVPYLLVRRITDQANSRAGIDFSDSTRQATFEAEQRILKALLNLALVETTKKSEINLDKQVRMD